ncbi:MAG: MFS transporter, partial [Chloroflexota bacterium]|nr:MFS transporter [Chloroflexota bacterium]
MKNRRSYLVYLFLGLAYTVCTSMIYPILPVYYVQEVGMNPLQLVLVGTTLEATILLFEVPTGVVADTYGRRLSVIVGEVLIGTGWVIQGSFPSFALVLLAAVIRGVGDTFISGALDAWIADEVGEEHLAQAYLRYGQARRVGFFAGIGVGVALASIQLGLPI